MHVQTDKPTSEARRVARVQYTVQYTRSKMLYTKAILIAFMRSVFILHGLCMARVMPPPPRSARWDQTMSDTLIIMSYIENQDEATATATIIASNAMHERAVSSLRRSGQRTESSSSQAQLCAPWRPGHSHRARTSEPPRPQTRKNAHAFVVVPLLRAQYAHLRLSARGRRCTPSRFPHTL